MIKDREQKEDWEKEWKYIPKMVCETSKDEAHLVNIGKFRELSFIVEAAVASTSTDSFVFAIATLLLLLLLLLILKMMMIQVFIE